MRRKRIKWTEEIAIELVLDVYNKEGKISQSLLDRYHGAGLYCYILKNMGGLTILCKRIGISHSGEVYLSKQSWTKERIASEIVKIHSNGEEIRSGYIQKHPKHKTLFRAARTHFGTWKDALTYSGFEPNDVSKHKHYTKNEVVSLIRELYEQGAIRERDISSSLKYSALRHFSSWRDAVTCSGFDYDKIVSENRSEGARIWDRYSILSEINVEYANGIKLNATSIESHNNGLYIAAIKEFGSWKIAMKEAGFPDYLGLYARSVSGDGFRFENILGEMLEYAGLEYVKGKDCNYANGLLPDFVLNESSRKIWVDAKLSEWTAASPNVNTIKNYEPLCDELIIIYLKGNNKDIKHSKKTRIVSVYSYFDKQVLDKYRDTLKEIENSKSTATFKGQMKITDEDVISIISADKSITSTSLANKYGVSQGCICNIRNGKTRRRVTGAYLS